MKNNPLISVIIPVYNVEPYLRQCLNSIVNQTYHNLELIVIDDGSPDNCGTICDEYADRDERIQVIHKENGGLSAARNDGIKRATGDWLTFVDSDDWCELNYYAELISRMGKQKPDIFFAGGRIMEFPYRKEVGQLFSDTFQYVEKKDLEKLMIGILAPPLGVPYGAPWDKLYSTEFVKNNHLLFDESSKVFEDLWFNFRAVDKANCVGGCTYIGYHYRIITSSITQSFNPMRPERNYDFLRKLQDYAKKHEKSSSIIKAIHARTLAVFKNTLDLYYFNSECNMSKKEIENDLRKMKTLQYYREAIWEKSNPYLTQKQKIFKYLLRMRSIRPLRIAYSVERKLDK